MQTLKYLRYLLMDNTRFEEPVNNGDGFIQRNYPQMNPKPSTPVSFVFGILTGDPGSCTQKMAL